MSRGGDRARAEELLVRFLAERTHDEEQRFRTLCRAHPELERELVRLYAELRRMDALLGGESREARADRSRSPPRPPGRDARP